MKRNSEAGAQLLKQLTETPQGGSFELPALIPSLDSTPVLAFLVEKEEASWTLACYWNGVSLGDVAAQVQGDTIILEDV